MITSFPLQVCYIKKTFYFHTTFFTSLRYFTQRQRVIDPDNS